MELLVAYEGDPAGSNMADHLAESMEKDGPIYRGERFDLAVLSSPVISADGIDRIHDYDAFVFMSRHAAESGVPALTCHSTGNFAEPILGGLARQVAVPHPSLQKQYLQRLHRDRERFLGFDITIEATHHGPTDVCRPSMFVEVGTTPQQWNDKGLCGMVADILAEVLSEPRREVPFAVCVGGTHYSAKFTGMALSGEMGLGTVIPKHSLEYMDEELFDHIIHRNKGASAILLDWSGLGKYKKRVMELAKRSNLQIRRI